MHPRRFLFTASLFLACLVVPMNWAHSQDTKTKNEIPPPRAVIDPKDVADLKTALAELKSKVALDAKKAEQALKDTSDALLKVEAAANAKSTDVPQKLTDSLTEMKESLSQLKAEVLDEDGTSKVSTAASAGSERGDTAWMLTSSALVLLMIPGLALFYAGMVRRKNVLATMMQSMAALAVVGVYWLAVGYALAFGPSVFHISALGVENGGLVGWNWDLVFLKGIKATEMMPGLNVTVYVHVIFQGMFAIITPALISGAIAERIRFWPFCIFMILWVTFVYCPLAHMVWAFDWFDPSVVAANRGLSAIGFLGMMGALDFAGGTVVHIAAGMAGLACCLVLGKRAGYPKMIAHPNSMVLTLLGAGLLWFGWFGFNGGSAVGSTALAASAFAATQAAAAAAGLGWMIVEWLHKGKPTALGLASGIVAGLVAVTPASGFVSIGGALCIGLAASVLCYLAVAVKNLLGYDDSLDAFGVHGVGGFVGAILTGLFCSTLVNNVGTDGFFAFTSNRARLEELKKDNGKLIGDAKTKVEEAAKSLDTAEKKLMEAAESEKAAAEEAVSEAKEIKEDKEATAKALEAELTSLQELADKQDDVANGGKDKKSATSQLIIQTKAAVFSVVYAFVLSLLLCVLVQAMTLGNFRTNAKGESEGLDRTEHDEVGFDFSAATESVAVISTEPRAASIPKGNGRFELKIVGADSKELIKVWTDLCQPSAGPVDPDFLAVYPHVTTVRGSTFRCRGGDPTELARRLSSLFTKRLAKDVRAVQV